MNYPISVIIITSLNYKISAVCFKSGETGTGSDDWQQKRIMTPDRKYTDDVYSLSDKVRLGVVHPGFLVVRICQARMRRCNDIRPRVSKSSDQCRLTALSNRSQGWSQKKHVTHSSWIQCGHWEKKPWTQQKVTDNLCLSSPRRYINCSTKTFINYTYKYNSRSYFSQLYILGSTFMQHSGGTHTLGYWLCGGKS